jgi:hypothetical protein
MGAYHNSFLGETNWFSQAGDSGGKMVAEDAVAVSTVDKILGNIRTLTMQAKVTASRSALDGLLSKEQALYRQGVSAADRIYASNVKRGKHESLTNVNNAFLAAYKQSNERLRANAASTSSLQDTAEAISLLGKTAGDLAPHLAQVYIAYEQGQITKDKFEEELKWMKHKRRTLQKMANELQSGGDPARAEYLRRQIGFFDDRMDNLGIKKGLSTWVPITIVGGLIVVGGLGYLLLR